MASDKFVINDITLSIPPENIEVYEDFTNNIYTPLRTNKASVVKTGHGIVRIKIRSRFSGINQLKDLHRLIIEFKYMPFAWIDNDLVRHQLKSKFADSLINFEKDSLAVAMSMLQLSTDEQLIDTLLLDLEMFLFNYKPYTSNFRFKSYSKDKNNKVHPIPLTQGPIDLSGNISQYQRYIDILSDSNDIPLITDITDDTVILKGNIFVRDNEFPSLPSELASIQPIDNSLSNVNTQYINLVGVVDTRMYPTARTALSLLSSAYYRKTSSKLPIQRIFTLANEKNATEDSILGLNFITTPDVDIKTLRTLLPFYSFTMEPVSTLDGYSLIYNFDHIVASNDIYRDSASNILANNISISVQDEYLQQVKAINDKNKALNRIPTTVNGVYKEPFQLNINKEFSNEIVTTQIQVVLQNNLSFLSVLGYNIPTIQYTGGNIASCIINFRTKGVNAIQAIKARINDIIQEALENRRFTAVNTLQVVNPVLNVAGLTNMIPDRIITEAVNNHIDTYNLTLQLIESNTDYISDVKQIKFSNDDIIRAVLKHIGDTYIGTKFKDNLNLSFFLGLRFIPSSPLGGLKPTSKQRILYNQLRDTPSYNGNELLSHYIDRVIGQLNKINDFFKSPYNYAGIENVVADIWGLNKFIIPSEDKIGLIPSFNNLNEVIDEVRINLKQIAEEIIKELILPNDAESIYPEFNYIREQLINANYGFDTCYQDMKLEVLRNEGEAATNIEPKELFFDDFYDGGITPFNSNTISDLQKSTYAAYESYKTLYGTLESNDTSLFEIMMNGYNPSEKQRALLDQKFESVWESVEPRTVPAEGYNTISSSFPTLDSVGAFIDDYIANINEGNNSTVGFGAFDGSDIRQITDTQGVVQSITQSIADHDIYFRSMQKAFPTFKIIFIEETPRGILKKSFDELYSASAVDNIEIISSRKSPVTVARISILNLYGHLDTLAWKGDPEDFNTYASSVVAQKLLDEEQFAPFERFIIRPGQKIKIKLGYSNDVEKLETAFIGEIVDITAGDRIEIIAQSYGKELVNTIKGWNPRERLFKYHNDTQRILCAMLLQPEVIHFGKWEPFGIPTITEEFEDITNELRDDNGNELSDISHGLLPWFLASNLKSIPNDDNIFAPITPFNPDRPVPGIVRYPLYATGLALTTVAAGAIGGTILPIAVLIAGISLTTLAFIPAGESAIDKIPKPTSFSWAARFNENSWYAYVVYQMTVWDVVKEMELRHPGCIGHPVPYGDRMTLFFGYPSLHYWKRPPTGIDITRQNRLKAVLKNEDALDRYIGTNQHRASFNEEREDLTNIILTYRLQQEENIGRFVPFRNYHLISADYNLLENNIRTGVSDVYNTIALQYLKDTTTRDQDRTYVSSDSIGDPVEGHSIVDRLGDIPRRLASNLPSEPSEEASQQLPVYDPDNLLVLKADDNILDQNVRMGHYAYFNCIGKTMAANYALGLLINNLKDIYRGEVKILGNERVKPYDTCFIFDFYNDMCGPFDVEQVIHRFSRDEGFVTCITPDLCVTANEWSTIPTQDAMFLFNYGWWMAGISSVNNKVFNTVKTISNFNSQSARDVFQNAVGLNKPQFLRDKIGYFEDLSGPLELTFASLFAAGLTLAKIGLYTQLRQPIFITPLFQGNKPFIAGIDGYYRDSILVNIRGKIVQWSDETSLGFKAMLSDITQYFTSNEVIVK